MITLTIMASASGEFQWHSEYKLLYVLNGIVRIDSVSEHFELSVDQMALFNPYDIYSVRMQPDSVLLELSVDIQQMDADLSDQHPRFLCNSHSVDNDTGYFRMRQALAHLVKIHNDGGDNVKLALKSQIYHMFYILSTYFPMTQETGGTTLRILEVLKYLNENCCERITLQSTADRFYLSAAYLSRLFKQILGINFMEYLNTVRISRSMAALEGGKISLVLLAEQYGFANIRAYKTAFSDKYGVTPHEYRRMLQKKDRTFNEAPHLSSNYLTGLAQYLTVKPSLERQTNEGLTTIVHVPDTDAAQKGFVLRKSLQKMTAIGRASQLLDANNQMFLREMQSEIGFEYIKFQGLLDNDMMVYHETENGEESYNFSYIDAAFDFLLEIRLKPFLQLCFMPEKLAANLDRITFLDRSVISLPKSIEKWNRLIASLFQHLVERYGLSCVMSWPVYIWNLPENPGFVFGIPDKQGFFDFYSHTYRTIKSINPDIRIGTPSILCETVCKTGWLDDFMEHCRLQGTEPEFLCVNAFAVEAADKSQIMSGLDGLIKSSDPDFIKTQLSTVRRILKTKTYSFSQIYVVEWNLTLIRENQQELLNDMAFKAAYIVKTYLDNHDAVSSLCHWPFSDSMREIWNSGQVFHGGNGLFTFNGLKKSAYHAFVLLSALRPQVISIGEGYVVTKREEDDTYAIMLYNYHHFSPLYASGEMFDMTPTNRYTPFDSSKSKRYEMSLCGLTNNKYTMTETVLNRRHGSAFDKWLEYGQVQAMAADDIQFLKAASIPWKRKQIVTVNSNSVFLSFTLEPHEVRLVELKPYNPH